MSESTRGESEESCWDCAKGIYEDDGSIDCNDPAGYCTGFEQRSLSDPEYAAHRTMMVKMSLKLAEVGVFEIDIKNKRFVLSDKALNDESVF